MSLVGQTQLTQTAGQKPYVLHILLVGWVPTTQPPECTLSASGLGVAYHALVKHTLHTRSQRQSLQLLPITLQNIR
jgi:hypothetical protein